MDPDDIGAIVKAGERLGESGLAFALAKPLLEKLLGPTAEYIGEGMKEFTKKRAENIRRIFAYAAKLLGPRLELPGAVPAKVLRGVIDDGSFADDELAAQYFGGVLASARTGVSRDDRGATFNALLTRLSSYQIRAHYVFYHWI